ncbi:het domain containing protein [Paraphaeosphaeria minitans]|uniref:Het domain containing protein n=1 Tax=Paraphaeosphaeria minitans TaxID=565426 RepID=A0A9P6GPX6_9PLEO|nr:het domain containing protein [Paraphaeosphaeria minitans]
MRLIHVDTLEIKAFSQQHVPDYAILSHTWGPDEVTFQEMSLITRMNSLSQAFTSQRSDDSQEGDASIVYESGAIMVAMEMLVHGGWGAGTNVPNTSEEALMGREGYRKIIQSAKEAKNLGYQWVWIDTCCIDKTSSAELQESINSMYKWYKESSICLVYLNDVAPSFGTAIDTQTTFEASSNAFTNSRWITRGWTLQELVAPTSLRFYYRDWTLMGDKGEFLEELSDATGIPIFVLENGEPSELAIAERMSWASYRQTTRIEDMAYCLLGIFDIQMPLLYEEGEKAFIRLQEEIVKTTDDYSLFAWRAVTSESGPASKSVYRGLLARSPLEFRDCRSVERDSTTCTFPTSATAIGLHLELEFLNDPKDRTRFLVLIRCNNSLNQRLAIYLKCIDGAHQYARVEAGSLVPIDNWPTGQTRSIYVRQKLSIPRDFFAMEMRRIRVQRRFEHHSVPPAVKIASVFPPSAWDPRTHELSISSATLEVFAVLFLRAQSSPYGTSTHFQVVVGFNRRSRHYWCKAMQRKWPHVNVDPLRWHAAIRKAVPVEINDPMLKDDVRHDIFVEEESGMGINVEVRAGLSGDCIGLQLLIDGFVKSA